jgi:small subunit ribosomal protein S4
VVHRLGLATTRAQARQLVTHRHVQLNGRRADIPSIQVAPGDAVRIAPGSPVEPLARAAAELTARVPAWLLADHDALSGTVVRAPAREDIDAPVDERLVVEFYARG